MIFQSAFAENGVQMEISPLLSDAYLRRRFERGSIHWAEVVRSYATRITALLRSRRFDLVLIHYELFPFWPSVFERLLRTLGVPFVLDLDDATFHTYDQSDSRIVQRFLGAKIAEIAREAMAVTCGSRYLSDFAVLHNRNVHLVPTVVDPARYQTKDHEPSNLFTVGWIGSPSTCVYLELLVEALQILCRESPTRVVVVGATWNPPGISVENRAWNLATEAGDLLDFDVGVMPLHDSPWTRGKCAYKLIQYMAAGLPTIASPIGANLEVVTPEVGFHAEGTEAWLHALRLLRDSPSLRCRLGASGRERCSHRFSLRSQVNRLLAIYRDAACLP